MANCGRRRGSSSRPKKRTKYLSLKRVITKSEVDTPPPPPDDDAPAPSSSPPPPWLDDGRQQQQVRKEEDGPGHLLQLQLHQVADPFAPHHEAASTLFAAVPAPSLSDILGASADSPSSPDGGVSGCAGFPAAEDDDLARRALRGRERWVYCRTGSTRTTSSSSPTTTTTATTVTTTTTTTTSSSPCSSAASTGASARSPPPPLLLKLDYDDILAAWADRGSLYYVARAAPNPHDGDLHDVLVEAVEPTTTTVGACAPPGTAASGGRAESVRRYREKRRNRLFAGRIRYEVRRVNAVKRPRFKGRFIKENEGIEVHPR